MIANAQAVVKSVNQNEVILEVSWFGVTKTVVESLEGRNPMLGWDRSFQAGEQLYVDISTSDLPEEITTEPWRICSIKTPELVCEPCT
jgi:hypothetical protein